MPQSTGTPRPNSGLTRGGSLGDNPAVSRPREGVPMRPLRVAVLDEELPFPTTPGKRIRTFTLLRRLADRHRVTVLCHRNPDPDEAAAADAAFRRLGIETVIVDRAVPPKSG